MVMPRYKIQLYETPDGRCPVESWLSGLTSTKRRAVAAALGEILEHEGPGVCGTMWGRWLGAGLFEFRIARSPVDPQPSGKLLLRIFRHPHGDKVISCWAPTTKGGTTRARIKRAR